MNGQGKLRRASAKVPQSPVFPVCQSYQRIRYDSGNDKIAVCISGGKDSMLMAKLFQELKRHNKFPFELVF